MYVDDIEKLFTCAFLFGPLISPLAFLLPILHAGAPRKERGDIKKK